jgi:hypothetical protein
VAPKIGSSEAEPGPWTPSSSRRRAPAMRRARPFATSATGPA